MSAAYTLSRQSGTFFNSEVLRDPELIVDLGPTTYTTPAITVQSVQFGVAYSTLSAFTRGKSRWPLEIVYSHGVTLAGSGGVVPATEFDRIELRIYTRFPRR